MKRLGIIFLAGIGFSAASFAAEPTSLPAGTPATLIERANADAVSRLYAQIAAETVGDVPVAQLINDVQGHQIVLDGLARAEQVGGPRVVGDGLVQVQLQISGGRAAQLVLQAVSVKPGQSPIAPDRLANLLQDWNQRLFVTTGASLTGDAAPDVEPNDPATNAAADAPSPPALQLDLGQPPAWAAEPLVSRATAPADTSALRTARIAEQQARDALRNQIRGLAIAGADSLGVVADTDESIDAVVTAAVDAAKIAGVDYHADGSVEVRIALDGQQLWQAILATR